MTDWFMPLHQPRVCRTRSTKPAVFGVSVRKYLQLLEEEGATASMVPAGCEGRGWDSGVAYSMSGHFL